MLDLNDVRVFAVVARRGTFSAAGRDLGLPTSTVARAITRLEEHLKVLLLRRGPRGIILTDAGTEFLATSNQALQTIKIGSETLQERSVNPCGLIRVCSPIVLANNLLVQILPEFLRRYPNLRVEIETYTDDFEREPREDVDVFFKMVPPRDSTRRMRKFPSIVRGLFACSEYVQRAGKPDCPEELLAHACIGAQTWKLKKAGDGIVEVAPRFRVITCDPVALRDLVLNGVGIAILPLYMARQPDVSGKLVPILPSWQPQSATPAALYFGPAKLAPKIKVFLDFVGDIIGTERDPRVREAPFEGLFGRSDGTPHDSASAASPVTPLKSASFNGELFDGSGR